jgi:hypothetical protein
MSDEDFDKLAEKLPEILPRKDSEISIEETMAKIEAFKKYGKKLPDTITSITDLFGTLPYVSLDEIKRMRLSDV